MSPMIADWTALLVSVLVALGIVALIRRLLVGKLARRWPTFAAEIRPCMPPAFVTAGLAAARPNLWHGHAMLGDAAEPVRMVVSLALIAAFTWLLISVAFAASDVYLAKLLVAEENGSSRAQRTRTQVTLLRRTVGAILAVLGAGAILFSFPAMRALGAGVLASAGVIGIVAGIAAQSTLGNLFAGLQLAFGDALRIGDTVIVQGEYGTIEELTLTYVVVKTWDERRLVLPVSFVTQTPFENWTKNGKELHGTVYLRLDWTVPVDELREAAAQWVAQRPEWDGRAWSLVVTDVLPGGLVEVRATVSAAGSGDLWKLRCDLREYLIAQIRDHHPQAIPRLRTGDPSSPSAFD